MPHKFCECEILSLLRQSEQADAGPVTVDALAAMLGTSEAVLGPVLDGMDGRVVVVSGDAPGRVTVAMTPEGRSLSSGPL
jgi:hypothetical protein